MEQGPGAATGGSFISLSENEQRCYSGLYTLCQADSSGKLASSKVGELFRASQLPAEILHQITEVCGAKRLGYFGTGQFYVALKLLAAAQSGLPVRLESITGDLPLPIFAGVKSEAEMRFPNHSSQASDGQTHPLSTNAGPVLRAVTMTATDRPAFRPPENSMEKQVIEEPWSPPRSPCTSPPQSPSTYCRYGYSAQRNGTEPLVGYEGKYPARPAMLQENSSPSHYSHKPAPEQPAITRALSTERLTDGATDDYSDDPWRITEEQRDYYTNQFRTLQPDLGGLILGTVAKNFFTKSKLPIPELSHIWELSDADRDGALTFPEFCTAFHLIVARKNGYPLPEKLPPSLRPSLLACGEVTVDSPKIIQPLIVFEDSTPRAIQQEKGMVEIQQASPLPALTTSKPDVRDEARKSELSPKRAVVTVATQEKPVQHVLPVSAANLKPDPPNELDPNMKSRTRPRSYSSTSIDDAMKKVEEPPTPPPRPQKSHSRASSLDLNKLFQQGSQGVKSGWLPPPPALPPRPPATQIPHFLPAADKPSQKAVQQPNFADFSRFREEEEAGVHPASQSPLRRAAGPSTEDLGPPKPEPSVGTQGHAPQKPVRRKYRPDSQNLEATPPATAPYPPAPAATATVTVTTSKPAQRLAPKQKREIQMAIRKNKETNAVLTRLNSELQQQLKVVHQERVTLESQLELLRPLTST
ncbi:ralBP1-associated Eps domain-containing protein 2 isoform X1 [Alosa sapidissima]|uniref:ralBP1-associated Eps domain-containing protein 2 isoform X1 n=1 Tax=Alosa sapidissima TaxID=34773 RepID=UPI001C0840A1|nr:ralBP1-associated Eps domain-containing protein 2 isoform X1 [Alosa sapidissima]